MREANGVRPTGRSCETPSLRAIKVRGSKSQTTPRAWLGTWRGGRRTRAAMRRGGWNAEGGGWDLE